MTSSRRPTGIARAILLTIPALSCSYAPDPTPETDTWVTQPDFEIGDAFGGPAAFAQVSDVRVSPDGGRVFVLEPYLARVSVWTPEGDLLVDIEKPGEGPGEFQTPLRVEPNPDGFFVQLQPRLLTQSDGYLAVPPIPGTVAAGWTGDDALDELPVLHIRADDDRWAMGTVAVLDVRNRGLSIRPAGSEWEFTWELHTGQPLADDDLTYFDSETGNVVIARRNLGDGSIQLLEVTPPGDTIWLRRFAVQPVSLRPELLEGAIDVFTTQLVNQSAAGCRPGTCGCRPSRKWMVWWSGIRSVAGTPSQNCEGYCSPPAFERATRLRRTCGACAATRSESPM